MKTKSTNRREVLKMAGTTLIGSAVAGLWLPACAPVMSASTSSNGSTDGATAGGSCAVIPTETAGPYPAHDDSAINVLRLNGIVRRDIRPSLNAGSYPGSATATGLPLTLTLNLVNASDGCTPLAGYAIYVWHCNVNGAYSMYSSGIANETYLRGVQVTDANGSVTFQTIFPACYDGRMTHVHFEVYPSLARAVDDNYAVKTSQLTFPMATMNSVYALSAYATSRNKLAQVSYSTDNVFSDGVTYQMATVDAFSSSTGVVAELNVGITA